MVSNWLWASSFAKEGSSELYFCIGIYVCGLQSLLSRVILLASCMAARNIPTTHHANSPEKVLCNEKWTFSHHTKSMWMVEKGLKCMAPEANLWKFSRSSHMQNCKQGIEFLCMSSQNSIVSCQEWNQQYNLYHYKYTLRDFFLCYFIKLDYNILIAVWKCFLEYFQ